jgi:hypothetical protein
MGRRQRREAPGRYGIAQHQQYPDQQQAEVAKIDWERQEKAARLNARRATQVLSTSASWSKPSTVKRSRAKTPCAARGVAGSK